jgi:lysine 2,3-aminomutase
LTVQPNGSRVYEFHPWEKNLSLVQTYIEVDVPILDYLRIMEKRGEDIDTYKSIWYYY